MSTNSAEPAVEIFTQEYCPACRQVEALLTEYGICHDAKNRHNLPPIISMGESGKEAWGNFTTALNDGRKS